MSMPILANAAEAPLTRKCRYAVCASEIMLIVAAAVIALLTAVPVRSDQVQQGPEDRTGLFHLTSLQGDLQFESVFDWRRVQTRREFSFLNFDRDGQKNRQWQFEETLGLQLEGDFLYPELLRYDVQLRLGLDQIWSTEDDLFGRKRDRDTGWLAQYDIKLDILSRKPVNANFYALRRDQRINRRFLPSLEHEMQQTGLTIRWENQKLPMELTIERNRDRYIGSADSFDDEDFDETLLRYNATWNINEYNQLQIDAQLSRLNERYSGSGFDFDTTRTVLNLDHRIQFGPEHQHVFETILEYQEDQGDLPRDHLTIVPQLTLAHSDTLSTRYRYQFSRDTFQSFELHSNRFDFGATHKLGKDLITTVDLYVGRETSDDGMSSNDYGGAIRWAYRRPNRWGVFSAALGYAYDSTVVRHDRRFGTAFDEVVFFRDPLPAYLAQSNVQVGSIIVTDLNRTRVFIVGRDYSVLATGTRTALVRVRTGRIDDRQSVLVAYRYDIAGRADYQTHQVDLRVQQDFDSGFSPYYAGSMQYQDLSISDDIIIDENDLNRHRLGLTYRKDRWSIGGELERNDDSIDPYDAVHANFDWAILNGYPNQLDLRVGGSQFWFRRFDSRQASLIDVSLDYRRVLNARTDFNAQVTYRFEDNSIYGQTHGIDAAAGLEYRIGLLTVSCQVEYDKLTIASADDDGVSVWLRVRRDIPNMLGR